MRTFVRPIMGLLAVVLVGLGLVVPVAAQQCEQNIAGNTQHLDCTTNIVGGTSEERIVSVPDRVVVSQQSTEQSSGTIDARVRTATVTVFGDDSVRQLSTTMYSFDVLAEKGGHVCVMQRAYNSEDGSTRDRFVGSGC
jgi:hypothetical protein